MPTQDKNGKRAPLLSILMVAYNDQGFLAGCLESIVKNITCSFEVILWNNGAPESIPQELPQLYPWLRVIQSERNVGFNAGNNAAARHASGKYILLLNTDTLLLTDVTSAVLLLDSIPQIGVIGAQAYDAAGNIRPSAGHFPKAWRLWLLRSLWIKPSTPFGPPELQVFGVDWVEGSFFMTSLANWHAIGGFDERNFLYGNDVDFCRSVSDRGLAVVQSSAVRYVHFGGYGVKRIGHLYAGFREYHRKFSDSFEAWMADFVLHTGLLARIAAYGFWYFVTKNGSTGDKLHGFVEVRRNWTQLRP